MVDLGATFIHGVKDNPITALANKYGIPLQHMDYDKISLYDSNGTLLSMQEFDGAKETYDELRKKFFEKRDRFNKDEDLQTSYEAIWRELNLDVTAKHERMLSWHFYWEIVQDQIAQLRELSSIEYDASLAFEGEDYMLVMRACVCACLLMCR